MTPATQDRAYNVEALTTATLGGRKLIEKIEWNADEPNVMRIMIPNFPAIYSCVSARARAEPVQTSDLIVRRNHDPFSHSSTA
jgi:hypothetical protein